MAMVCWNTRRDMERCSGKIPIRNRRDEKFPKAPRFSVSKKNWLYPMSGHKVFIFFSNVVKIPPGCDMSSHRFSFWLKYVRFMGFKHIFGWKPLCRPYVAHPTGIIRWVYTDACSEKRLAEKQHPDIFDRFHRQISWYLDDAKRAKKTKKMFQADSPESRLSMKTMPEI